MSRSFSKIRHIQESNRILESRLISEQPESRFGLERFGYNPNKPETLDAAAAKQTQFNQDVAKMINPHTLNTILAVGALFIPVVGPFVSAGIGLMDAGLYLKEGKKSEAAVVAAFSLLPGIGSIVNKIPGIKQLGAKGMSALAGKVVAKQALNATELAIVDGIAVNQALIRTELNQAAKNIASNAAGKVASAESKEALKKVAEHGLEHYAQHEVVAAAGGKKHA